MSTFVCNQTNTDRNKAIDDIVDRLKKQGLFDTFRKECLADVDTKPAYQNLRHRVEGAVARFLSTQTWRPDLNKNQLRDSLRRHITESQMLAAGVDRVVEQVVNPKISQVFKAEVDKAICEYLGIDQEAWEAKLRQREELRAQIQQLEQQQKHREQHPGQHNGQHAGQPNNHNGSIPSLMELDVPTHANNPDTTTAGAVPGNQTAGTQSTANMRDVNSALLALSNTVPGNNARNTVNNAVTANQNHASSVTVPVQGINLAVPYPPSSVPNYNYPIQQGAFPGMTQGVFPAGFPNMGFPPGIQGMPGMPNYWPGMMNNMGMLGVPMMPSGIPDMSQLPQNVINPPLPGVDPTETQTDTKEKKKEKSKKKELEPLTVESFLNIPLPKSEPPKVKEKKKESDAEKKTSHVTSRGLSVAGDVVVVDDIVPGDQTKTEDIECEEVTTEQMQVEGVVLDGTDPSDKVYHFAWENEDVLSDVDVSSIHTSDLSSFYEDGESAPELREGGEEEEEEEEYDEDKDDQETAEEVMEDTLGSGTPVSSPTKEPVLVAAQKPKVPRKLISLSYNYSDSDEDETREERKARIAREKEERYLRRQQRRAELEAKRKEREEERLRLRAERDQDTEGDVEVSGEVSQELSGEVSTQDRPKEPQQEPTPVQDPEVKEPRQPVVKSNTDQVKGQEQVKGEKEKEESIEEPVSQSEDLTEDDSRSADITEPIEDRDSGKPDADITTQASRKDPGQVQPEAVPVGGDVVNNSNVSTDDSKNEVDMADVSKETQEEVSSPQKPPTPLSSPVKKRYASPRKRPRITKEEAKEILREQKVMEKRMALRRQRTKNRRYTSDEFTSIFTERKNLLTGVSDDYIEEEVVVEQAVEIEAAPQNHPTEIIEIDLTECLETPDADQQQYVFTVSQTQEEVITSAVPVSELPPASSSSGHMTRSKLRQVAESRTTPETLSQKPNPRGESSNVRPDSPYSDISDSSKDSIDSRKDYHHSSKHQDNQEHREQRTPESVGNRTRSHRLRHHSPSPDPDHHLTRGDSERQHSQRYDNSDLYKPRMSYGGSRRRQRSPSPDEKVRTIRNRRTTEDSAYEPITTPEHDDFDDAKSDDERSSASTSRSSSRSRSRSRSHSKSRSKSRSWSRSRSRSRSSTRSRTKSSETRTRTSSRSSESTSVSKSNDSEDDEDKRHRPSRVPVDKISFGEAAKRVKTKFIEDVDFGEAERQFRMSAGYAQRGFPGQGNPAFRGGPPVRGRGVMMRGGPPVRGAPRSPFPGLFMARGGPKRGMSPIRGSMSPRGGATSPRGSSTFRTHQGPFQPYQRSKFLPEGGDFVTSSPEKRRPWLRNRSSEGEGTPTTNFTRSASQEDTRSRSSGNMSPPSEDYGRYWEGEEQEEEDVSESSWGRGSSKDCIDRSLRSSKDDRRPRSSHSRSPLGRGTKRPHSPGQRNVSPEMEEGETRTPSDRGSPPDSPSPPGGHPLSPPLGSPPPRRGRHSPPPHILRKFRDVRDVPPSMRHESRRSKHGVLEGASLLDGPPHRTSHSLSAHDHEVRLARRAHSRDHHDHIMSEGLPRRPVSSFHDESPTSPGAPPLPGYSADHWRVTRAGRKRSEEENAPIAKRLRQH